MPRLKLLLFAVPALVLWLADLSITASSLSAQAEQQAVAYASRATDAVSIRVAARRSELQALAMRLGTAPGTFALLEAVRSSRGDGGVERLQALRKTAGDAVSSALRSTLILGVRTDAAALFARGPSEPAPTLPGVETETLAGAGTDGQTREAFGSAHLFFSMPLTGADKDGRPLGMLIVGGPLMPEGAADQVALELGLSALGFVSGGRIVTAGGPDRDKPALALRETPVGKSAAAVRGSAGSFGFLRLPLWTSGPDPALRMAVRRSIPGQPLELLAVASVEPFMSALADAQRFGLMCIALLAAALAGLAVWAARTQPAVAHAEETSGVHKRTSFVRRRTRSREQAEAEPEPTPLPAKSAPSTPPRPPEPPPEETRRMPSPPERPKPDFAPEPDRAEPEAFSLPERRRAEAPRTPLPRTTPAPAARPSPKPLSPGFTEYDQQPTMAYPIPDLPDFNAPPSAVLPAPTPLANAIPEETRVADVSPELLEASSRFTPTAMPNPLGRAPMPPAQARLATSAPYDADEVHFHEVYRDFVATRERCAEPADGLTYDKFANKLRDKREQLIQRFGYRTVRFNVYVKDGKAALKATPVKD